MPEYIEREEAIKTLKDNVTEMEGYIYFGSNLGVPEDEIEDILNEIPTADVVEVRHGEWVEKGYEGIMTYCSECLHRAPFNNHQELILSNYCPNCGTKMDGKGD